ncbi:phosphopantothenate--cysteine ligase [Monomorium pharaonis]|uniref:phosphopantothenate--cysteine ligase n=1 Tax=Monomorium pharaonis TaxID=307658 RepID=UPI00063F6500|nr:phosphopantothenate--cysteine ligase [Monomorium pharaonis]XP_012542410.1 phosphopantothenate--cysteine ligase [Monomorium pharaonis]XP_012542417.1 phosphopantothenate--cysteine ligase [Monomorium pharaonis]XP_028045846.1 phosphopantothenate--cysteine ligase [Monomorium pharaonis]
MVSTWEDFYAKHPPPPDLAQNEQALKEFTRRHLEAGNKVVLVTSGGTTVPLEHNTVRFVDNFSAGTRGSVSAEYFLEHGYAVIFMYRIKSLEPFSRHFLSQKFLDLLQISDDKENPVITVLPEYTEKVATVLRKYREAFDQKKLLQLTFTALSEYLWLLRSACQALAPLENKAILYLAAAVSDFYIPSNEMSVHKISSSGPPTISLQLVPKILAPLVSLWVPKAFVVSFKLETDESLLISKARTALNKYQHNLVIANILQTRKQQVTIVSKETNYVLFLTNEQLDNGEEIEKLIVSDLVEKHQKFILRSKQVS